MEAHWGPELDTDELRSRFGAAMATYEETAAQLNREKVDVRAVDFGEGFAVQGARIVSALETLHGTTLSYLDNRRGTWNSILALVDDVENQDGSGAAAFGGVSGL